MASCGLFAYTGTACGGSLNNPDYVECVPLRTCEKAIQAHLRTLNVWDKSLETESQLILSRAGTCTRLPNCMFRVDLDNIMVCDVSILI